MSNTHRILNLINDCKKYDEVFFLCNYCAEETKSLAAVHGGRVINTTHPNHCCTICKDDENRWEYRA